MKTHINLTILTLLFLLLFMSCNKDYYTETRNEGQIQMKSSAENYFSFPDDEAFFNAIDLVGNLEHEQLINFTLEAGIMSYLAVYDSFLDKANDENLTEEEYYELLEEYSDILIIFDDVIEPRINHPLVWHFINREGIVKVGRSLVLYTDSEKIVSESGDLQELLNAVKENTSSEDIYRFHYRQDNGSRSPACGWWQQAQYQHGNNRRARLTVETILEMTNHWMAGCPNNTGRKFKSWAVSTGQSFRRNMWGNWVAYKTTHTLDLKYRASTFGNHPHTGYPWTVTVNFYQHWNSNAYWRRHQQLIVEYNDCFANQGNYQAYFNWMNPCRHSTRGIGDNWASITCSQW